LGVFGETRTFAATPGIWVLDRTVGWKTWGSPMTPSLRLSRLVGKLLDLSRSQRKVPTMNPAALPQTLAHKWSEARRGTPASQSAKTMSGRRLPPSRPRLAPLEGQVGEEGT